MIPELSSSTLQTFFKGNKKEYPIEKTNNQTFVIEEPPSGQSHNLLYKQTNFDHNLRIHDTVKLK